MAKFVLVNNRVFFAGAELSGDTNEATIAVDKEIKDVTNFLSQGWREVIGGLGSAKIDVKGYVEASATPLTVGAPDDTGWTNLGTIGGITLAPTGAADQAPVYFTNVLESSFAPIQGKVGDVAGFQLMTVSDWAVVRGVVANPPGSAITTTGTGTINNLGAVATGQQLYADLHIISVSGSPTITFSVQSAALVGFGSPTTRLTFAPATAIGGQILRTPGPITDAFYRAQWTVSGSGSILAVMSFGIA